PGYGDSPGVASAAAMQAMSSRMSAFASETAGDRDLVFWGHSLGGIVCAQLAGETPQTDGVILEATAQRAAAVARAWTPWYAKPFVRVEVAESLAGYDTAHVLAGFHGPILVLGAALDETLPVELSRSLAHALEAAHTRVHYVEFANADHASISQQPEFAAVASAYFENLRDDHD
ncbi:MAG TPA: prolyl oligopeptidase family serine peptidase, partial [Verrucomicrobiae bacterium]|nr:prolyl oligopeptidase family serine peptidase [Verrucomicrobiae bacterium]